MKKTILVTGASSGIGLDISRSLAEKGHQVYATARHDSDLTHLAQIENIHPLNLDVTHADQIKSAVRSIREAGLGLDGLVNHAGLGGLGACHSWNESEIQELFNVNTLGPWRMSNAVLPLLLESRGRIVNIGSQGGMITQKYFGPYTMTKHALEAYTEAMRDELQSHGIQVSIVQPGGIVSSIGPNALPGILNRLRRAKPPFKAEAEELLKQFQEAPEKPSNDEPESASHRKPSDPAIVSEAVHHALFSTKPRDSYLVGTKWEGDRVINALFRKILAANESPLHGYTRDELIILLDKHLSKTV